MNNRLVLAVLIIFPQLSSYHITPSSCPPNMVHVEGWYCPVVEQRCLSWIDPLRCRRFQEPSRCLSRTRRYLNFCIDRFEYPNIEGVNPQTMITWFEADRLCHSQGKRLCHSHEWTFACEGENILPYPYGHVRDSGACRIDHQRIRYNPSRLANPLTMWDEARRAYEGVPSGYMNRCVSPFGVHDTVGNVDEYVINDDGNPNHAPYVSGLKGGWWANVRNRCRPMTTIHGPGFRYYNISTRCCI